MKILVVVEIAGHEPTFDSLALLSKAATLQAETWALVCGHGIAHAPAKLGAVGAAHVIVADSPYYADPLPERRIALIAELWRAHKFAGIFFAASTLATDIAGGGAAELEAGINWGLTAIEIRDDKLVGARLGRDDTILVDVGWKSSVAIGLFRPSATELTFSGKGTPSVHKAAIPDTPARLRFLGRTPIARDSGPGLSDARIVVGAGRGIGNQETLPLVQDLADALGGVLGVSLPVVDMGWAPRAKQVGQTGIVIKPRLYVACGISGQIQHRLGMEHSRYIIAINTDRDAPIMQFCDLGIIADLHKLLPQLIEAIKQR
jgi:electron transfer flavoprotein alpha subunit